MSYNALFFNFWQDEKNSFSLEGFLTMFTKKIATHFPLCKGVGLTAEEHLQTWLCNYVRYIVGDLQKAYQNKRALCGEMLKKEIERKKERKKER
jgi:hypothetical protein